MSEEGGPRDDEGPVPGDYVERILTARVYDVAIESPLDRGEGLSKRLENSVWLKREDLQPTHSFKCRGAYNAVALRLERAGPDGNLTAVIAASAGNHAQGVALAAKRLGLHAILVMPEGTPRIKVQAVAALGSEVILAGDNFDAAAQRARELAEDLGYPLIHPFDDPDIIAGQGTIGLELCRQHPNPIHALFVPVGGGGLLAGIAVLLKRLRPGIRIVGVEPQDSDAMARSLRAGRQVRLDHVGKFADGVAVKEVGREPFELCRQFVDQVVVVSADEICAAMKHIFDDTRVVMEPAGALAMAGLERYVSETGCRGETLVAITSGSNLEFDLLGYVAGRVEVGMASLRGGTPRGVPAS
ncbi:MAG: threonine ammonia-lyase, biosynthetic [Thermoanaerobaculia bacterium]|nr:threonine ammonia-lyase, biosynthetic [Thermoanaerobaculia bacterium]